MASELNRWEKSLPEGKLAEAAFALLMGRHMGINVVSNNTENIKAEDCRCDFIAEIKVLRSPYPRQRTPAGLDSSKHITLDQANIDKYHDNTLLALIVDYTEQGVDTEGLYCITAKQVRQIVKDNPDRVYSRSARTVKDKSVKIGISTDECAQIRFGNMTGKETARAFLDVIGAMRARNERMKELAS